MKLSLLSLSAGLSGIAHNIVQEVCNGLKVSGM